MLFDYHVSRSWQPCGDLLGKGYPLGSLVCVVFVCFATFQHGFLSQLWYLIESIPDICLLPYLYVGGVLMTVLKQVKVFLHTG